jgi:hypothetical protein
MSRAAPRDVEIFHLSCIGGEDHETAGTFGKRNNSENQIVFPWSWESRLGLLWDSKGRLDYSPHLFGILQTRKPTKAVR